MKFKNAKKIKIFIYITAIMLTISMIFSSAIITNAQSATETTKESIDIVEYNCDTGEETEYTFEYNSIDITSPEAAQQLTSSFNSEKNIFDNTNTISPYTILPDDGEIYPVNATVSPHSKVLLIKSRFSTNDDGTSTWGYGTAFMIAPNIALTAAHCVQQEDLGYATTMRAYKKQQGKSLSSNYVNPLQWSLPVNYTQNIDLSYDWCIIKFGSDLGLGYFDYQVPTSNTEVFVNGYPHHQDYIYSQYRNGGLFLLCDDGRMFDHSCSTLGGQSGGPAYKKDGVVIGIHTMGQRNSSDLYNHGCIITQALYNLIEKCKNE